MEQYTPIYEVEYKLTTDDYYQYNLIVYGETMRKKSRTQTLLGIFSELLAGVVLSTLFITSEFQVLFLALVLVLVLFGIYSIIYYPLIFPGKLRRSVEKNYKSKNLGEQQVLIKFADAGITEQMDGSGQKITHFSWQDFQVVYIYDHYIVMMMENSQGILIPSRILKRQYDAELKAYVIYKCKENHVPLMYQRPEKQGKVQKAGKIKTV